MNYLHYILSGLIASLLISTEILFTKYKQTSILIIRQPHFLVLYAIVYFIFADICMYLVHLNNLKINEVLLSENPIIISIFIGVAIKSIVQINFYTFKTDKHEIHLGLKLISIRIEEYFEQQISDIHDEALLIEVKRVAKKVNAKGNTLNKIDSLLKECLPTGLNLIKTDAYMKEITQRQNKYDKLQYFTLQFGLKRLKMFESNFI